MGGGQGHLWEDRSCEEEIQNTNPEDLGVFLERAMEGGDFMGGQRQVGPSCLVTDALPVDCLRALATLARSCTNNTDPGYLLALMLQDLA